MSANHAKMRIKTQQLSVRQILQGGFFMKLKVLVLTLAASIIMGTTALAAQTVSITANDGSTRESGNYTAFSISNVTSQEDNGYGWITFDVDAPAVIKVIDSVEGDTYVLD